MMTTYKYHLSTLVEYLGCYTPITIKIKLGREKKKKWGGGGGERLQIHGGLKKKLETCSTTIFLEQGH
jgi:hypothetical protein